MTAVANFTPKSAILSFVITHELLTKRLFLDSLANKYFRMKVIKNKTIDFATAVQAPVINGNRAARTGYVRLVRLITDEPVPQQTSYTGKIELR